MRDEEQPPRSDAEFVDQIAGKIRIESKWDSRSDSAMASPTAQAPEASLAQKNDEPSSVQEMPKGTIKKSVLRILSLVATTAVTTLVTLALTGGWNLATSAAPLKIRVENDPMRLIKADPSESVIIPAGHRVEGDPGPVCGGFYSWGHLNGGVQPNPRFQIIVQGDSSDAVLISSIRIDTIRRAPPVQGVDAVCPSAGDASIRALRVDLDAPGQPLTYTNPNYQGKPIAFTLMKGETEIFDITASTSRYSYSFYVDLDLIVNGKFQTMRVGMGGVNSSAPFLATADIGQQRWFWDYQSTWKAEGQYSSEKNSDGTDKIIKAGQQFPG